MDLYVEKNYWQSQGGIVWAGAVNGVDDDSFTRWAGALASGATTCGQKDALWQILWCDLQAVEIIVFAHFETVATFGRVF